MNIHFIMNHKYIAGMIIFSFVLLISFISSSIFISLISRNPNLAEALGTWVVGGIGAFASFYYFEVDRKRDIELQVKSEYIGENLYFITQAFNNSKLGNVILPSAFLFSPEKISYQEAKKIYKNDKENTSKEQNTLIPFFNIVDENSSQRYYSVKPFDITPEIKIDSKEIFKSIAEQSYSNGNKESIKEYYMAIIFSDVKDDPYILRYKFDGKFYTSNINAALNDVKNKI